MADTSRSVESIIKELERDWNNFLKNKWILGSYHDYFDSFQQLYILNDRKPWSECINNPTTASDRILKEAVDQYLKFLKERYIFTDLMSSVEDRLRSSIVKVHRGGNEISEEERIIRDNLNYIQNKIIEDKISDNTLFMAACFELDGTFYRSILQNIFLPLCRYNTDNYQEQFQILGTKIIEIITNYFSEASQSQAMGSELSRNQAKKDIAMQIYVEVRQVKESINPWFFQSHTAKELIDFLHRKIGLETNRLRYHNWKGFMKLTVEFNTPLKTMPQKPEFSREILETRIDMNARTSSDSEYHMPREEKLAQKSLWAEAEARKRDQEAEKDLWDATKEQTAQPSTSSAASSSSSSSSSADANPPQRGFFAWLFGAGAQTPSASNVASSSSSSNTLDIPANPSEENNIVRTTAMGYSDTLLDYLTEFKLKPGAKSFKQSFHDEKISDPEDDLCCHLTLEVPNIPVKLYKQIYDLSALEALPMDENGKRRIPHTQHKFLLAEIAPAPKIKRALEAIIAENNKKSTVSTTTEKSNGRSISNIPEAHQTFARPNSPVSSSFPGFAHSTGGEPSSASALGSYSQPDLTGRHSLSR